MDVGSRDNASYFCRQPTNHGHGAQDMDSSSDLDTRGTWYETANLGSESNFGENYK